MSEIQRQQAQGSKILLVAGSLCSLFGMFMYAQRNGFAEFFMGARFLFGMPYTNDDAFKVFLITAASSITIVMGVVLLAVGVALFLKSSAAGGASPSGTATSTH
jgi:hypothetical protein